MKSFLVKPPCFWIDFFSVERPRSWQSGTQIVGPLKMKGTIVDAYGPFASLSLNHVAERAIACITWTLVLESFLPKGTI